MSYVERVRLASAGLVESGDLFLWPCWGLPDRTRLRVVVDLLSDPPDHGDDPPHDGCLVAGDRGVRGL
jgi:hypothetical protein